jgi:rare lipoprotein A
MVSGGLLVVLNTAPAVKAQPLVDPTATFAERFSLESRALPTFTRPEVQQLWSFLQKSATTAVSAAPTNITVAEPQPRTQIIFAQPKGPAKVLKELLTTPVTELLVSRAEAEPEQAPSGSQEPGRVPVRPAADLAGMQSAQDIASVPSRNADPVSERPPPENAVTGTPLADQVATPRPEPDGATAGQHIAAERDETAHEQGTLPSRLEDVAETAAAPAGHPVDVARPQTGTAPSLARAEAGGTQANAASRASRPQAMTTGRSRRIATGRASWYQHPGRTASGEKFNPNQLTAAHHTLPFGTRVRVVHEQTGRSVNVRINDRIPRSTRVLIDLSRASARALGVQGVAWVSLYRG